MVRSYTRHVPILRTFFITELRECKAPVWPAKKTVSELSRENFPGKTFQGKLSREKLSRENLPGKTFQGTLSGGNFPGNTLWGKRSGGNFLRGKQGWNSPFFPRLWCWTRLRLLLRSSMRSGRGVRRLVEVRNLHIPTVILGIYAASTHCFTHPHTYSLARPACRECKGLEMVRVGPESRLQHLVSLPWIIGAQLVTAPCLAQMSPLQDGGNVEEVQETVSTEV